MVQKTNGEALRELIEKSGLSQPNALAVFNRGQARPLSLSQWKAYLANPSSERRSPCPDAVLDRAKKILKQT